MELTQAGRFPGRLDSPVLESLTRPDGTGPAACLSRARLPPTGDWEEPPHPRVLLSSCKDSLHAPPSQCCKSTLLCEENRTLRCKICRHSKKSHTDLKKALSFILFCSFHHLRYVFVGVTDNRSMSINISHLCRSYRKYDFSHTLTMDHLGGFLFKTQSLVLTCLIVKS